MNWVLGSGLLGLGIDGFATDRFRSVLFFDFGGLSNLSDCLGLSIHLTDITLSLIFDGNT